MTSNVLTGDEAASPMLSAFKQVAPIVMGYLPVGAAYGVLAQQAGLSMLNTVLMSILVYAGSAQLIAVALFAVGVSPLSIIATTFVVNLRHLLMSASLAPNLKTWKKWELALFAYQVTDESFAVHSTRFARGDLNKTTCFGINYIAQASWAVASFAGFMAGSSIPDVEPLGIDYALPAMFIALLVMQTKNKLHILVAGFTGFVSIALVQAGADQWSVIIATVVGATFGAGVETWARK
ncbi:AzlC family ABC transporter permease [Pseudodesulfovibrio sediminis]|uniref:Branched-chain amino acid permease n=1 Tax=Pseudodesulfovibrio sediminis TaxID=2810563 RepID=A0ABM7P4R8_9BACT|nr:AzlC family ABC transporter permease [Pseudodesulfovibrio sediminis]BCS87847.1 branched-chain amino acid permease [Pseudodesulfovibrio sediminis]